MVTSHRYISCGCLQLINCYKINSYGLLLREPIAAISNPLNLLRQVSTTSITKLQTAKPASSRHPYLYISNNVKLTSTVGYSYKLRPTVLPLMHSGSVRMIGHNRNPHNTNKEWSITKKLALLWSGGLLAIVLVICVDFAVHAQYVEGKERKRKLERVQGDFGVLKYFFSTTCMRNTVLLMILSGFGAWIATFLLTSNLRKANLMLLNTPAVIGALFFAFCTMQTSEQRDDVEKFNNAMEDVKARRQLGDKTSATEETNKTKED